MSKLSIAFNAYTVNGVTEEMAIGAIRSFRPHVDEIVFSEDGGIESTAIRGLVDQYIWHENLGSCRCTNIGWNFANDDADFVINAQTDTSYVSGNLRDLCLPDKITNPLIVDKDGMRTISNFNGDQHSEFFCVPRLMKEKYGTFDERMRNYHHEFLYFDKIVPDWKQVESVVVCHLGHGTINQLVKQGWDERRYLARDWQIYQEILRENR